MKQQARHRLLATTPPNFNVRRQTVIAGDDQCGLLAALRTPPTISMMESIVRGSRMANPVAPPVATIAATIATPSSGSVVIVHVDSEVNSIGIVTSVSSETALAELLSRAMLNC